MRVGLVSGVVVGAVVLSGACGSDGGGTEVTAPQCTLVGAAVALPVSSNFDVAATGSGWVVLIADSSGVGAFTLGSDGALGARETVGLPASGPVLAQSLGDSVIAASTANASFDGVRVATRADGVWTTAQEPGVEGQTTFDYGSTIAVSGTDVAVVWVSGTATGAGPILHVTDYRDGAFVGTSTVPPGGIPALVGTEVEASFDSNGSLWVVVGGDDGSGFNLFSYVRRSGLWGRAEDLGPIEGSFANISIAGMGTNAAGDVGVVVVEPASFIDDVPGGARSLSLSPGFLAGDGPNDDRPVVEGVDVAPMAGYGLLATASWGENNLDITQSRDAAVVYACDGPCRKVLDLEARNGTFYGRAKIATRGLDGVVVFERTNKGPDGVDQTVAQRFACEAPE